MPTWIDFKELRAKLKFESLLRFYQIEVHRKGDQHQGPCPLPNHRGKKAPLAFSANLTRGIFQCFGCGAKGSALDFAILMEGANPQDGREVRNVALKLRRELLTNVMPVCSKRFPTKAPKAAPPAGKPKVLVNAPLDFELKELEADHLCLLKTGLVGTTTTCFGLGYCSRGMFKGRIAIPLHDGGGKLVGYAGEAVDDNLIVERAPQYLFPTTRERNGTIYEFRKSALLYNSHRVKGPCDDLIVVEWFPSVWWLHQNGYPHVVALMGSVCSDEQAEQIVSLVKPSGHLWLLPEGHRDGVKLAHSLLERLSPHRFMRWVKINEGVRPTELDATELKFLLTV